MRRGMWHVAMAVAVAGLVTIVLAAIADWLGYVAAGLAAIAISAIGLALILRSFPAGPRW